ncbi:MAG TPA: hypothetical protein VGJ31_03750, partial [Dongiaceae bacterium]
LFEPALPGLVPRKFAFDVSKRQRHKQARGSQESGTGPAMARSRRKDQRLVGAPDASFIWQPLWR